MHHNRHQSCPACHFQLPRGPCLCRGSDQGMWLAVGQRCAHAHQHTQDLEKISDFFTDNEETYIIKVAHLGSRVSQASTPKEKEDLHEQLDAVRQQLTLLLNWVEVNFVAVGKILKKHGTLACLSP